MGKLSKEEAARYGGAVWMVEYIKKNGIEAAEKELEIRGARNIPLGVNKTDLHKFEVEEKKNTIATILLMTCATLHDEYGFGYDRMNRFIDRFNMKTECIVDNYVDWTDIQQTIQEETGLLIPLPQAFKREG